MNFEIVSGKPEGHEWIFKPKITRPQVEWFLVWKFTPARVVFQRLSQNSIVAVIYLVYTTTISVNFQFWKFTLFEWIFNSENSLPGSEFMDYFWKFTPRSEFMDYFWKFTLRSEFMDLKITAATKQAVVSEFIDNFYQWFFYLWVV